MCLTQLTIDMNECLHEKKGFCKLFVEGKDMKGYANIIELLTDEGSMTFRSFFGKRKILNSLWN